MVRSGSSISERDEQSERYPGGSWFIIILFKGKIGVVKRSSTYRVTERGLANPAQSAVRDGSQGRDKRESCSDNTGAFPPVANNPARLLGGGDSVVQAKRHVRRPSAACTLQTATHFKSERGVGLVGG